MQKIHEIDFIRVISTLGIVIFHFSLANKSCRFLIEYGAGDYGTIFVNVFFMVSGFCLYCNNREINRLYFWKRIKSIFPMFYIAYGIIFVRFVSAYGKFFFLDVKKPLILTLFGMDGYFLYKGTNYYILGEWFLGAILLIYFLYPLLLYCIEKCEMISSIVMFILYVGMLWAYALPKPLFEIKESRNLISCIICFWIGMLLYRHSKEILYHRLLPLLGILIFLGSRYIPQANILNHFAAFGLFFLLFGIGTILFRSTHITTAFSKLATLSYPVFLVHHVLINDMANLIDRITAWTQYSMVLSFLLIVTLLQGWALLQVGNAVTQLPFMKNLEDKIKESTL